MHSCTWLNHTIKIHHTYHELWPRPFCNYENIRTWELPLWVRNWLVEQKDSALLIWTLATLERLLWVHGHFVQLQADSVTIWRLTVHSQWQLLLLGIWEEGKRGECVAQNVHKGRSLLYDFVCSHSVTKWFVLCSTHYIIPLSHTHTHTHTHKHTHIPQLVF